MQEVFKTKLIQNSNNVGFEWTVDWKDFDKKGATVSDVEAILIRKEKFKP